VLFPLAFRIFERSEIFFHRWMWPIEDDEVNQD
jgi:hypothetical protein